MEKICFVIQPFNEKFNKRYDDIIKPAIEKCGLVPYRVDEDNSVIIPIDSIEEMIKRSSICVAEITTNNPNVWYEVGYAVASKIPIVLICSDERTEQYPFDVRHRNILHYTTMSLGDYKKIKSNLIDRITNYLELGNSKNKKILEELTAEEKEILLLIAQQQVLPNQVISQKDIQCVSINKENFILTLRKLINHGYIQYIYALENGATNNYCKLTPKAEEWVLENT